MVTATSGSQTIARGAAVSISHLHHAFTLGKQAVPVLENISLQLRPGKAWRCWVLPAAVNPPCCGCWPGWKRRRADRCSSTARRSALPGRSAYWYFRIRRSIRG